MKTLNLKAFASAFAALAVTFVLSWTFVDATQRRPRAHPRRRRLRGRHQRPGTLRSLEHSDGPAVGRQPADIPAVASTEW